MNEFIPVPEDRLKEYEEFGFRNISSVEDLRGIQINFNDVYSMAKELRQARKLIKQYEKNFEIGYTASDRHGNVISRYLCKNKETAEKRFNGPNARDGDKIVKAREWAHSIEILKEE